MSRTSFCAGVFLAATLLPPALAGNLAIVDPAGGDGVALLESVIAAAHPGDTLWLKDGDYFGAQGHFYVIQEGLTLLPAPGAARPNLQRIAVKNLPADQTVVLRDIDLGGPGSLGTFEALLVEISEGSLWLEDCTVVGDDAQPKSGIVPQRGQGALRIGPYAHAILRHCVLRGGRGADAVPLDDVPYAGGGGSALRVDFLSSSLALHDCQLVGGNAGDGPATDIFLSGDGAAALELFGGDATIAGCTLLGGDEGAGNDGDPGSSGPALDIKAPEASVRALSSTFTAGMVQGDGDASPAIQGPLSGLHLLAEPARSLVLPAQGQEGESVHLLVDGEPGDLLLVLLSANATLIPLPGQEGALVTDLASLLGPIALGTLPAPDGQFDLAATLPELPAGTVTLTIYVQGVFKDADGTSLGGASALTLIDSAF